MRSHHQSKLPAWRRVAFAAIIAILLFVLIIMWVSNSVSDTDSENETDNSSVLDDVISDLEDSLSDEALELKDKVDEKIQDEVDKLTSSKEEPVEIAKDIPELTGCQTIVFAEGEAVKYDVTQITLDKISKTGVRFSVAGNADTLALGESEKIDDVRVQLSQNGIFYIDSGHEANRAKLTIGCKTGESEAEFKVREVGELFCADVYDNCMDNFDWEAPEKDDDDELCKTYFFFVNEEKEIAKHDVHVQAIAADAIILQVDEETTLLGEGEVEYLGDGIEVALSNGDIQYFGQDDESNAVELRIGCDKGVNPVLKDFVKLGENACEDLQEECEASFEN